MVSSRGREGINDAAAADEGEAAERSDAVLGGKERVTALCCR